jgi:predicted amidohydrolase
MSDLFRVALASPPFPRSIADALSWVERHTREAASRGAEIVCFPESYVPGMRGIGLPIEDHSPDALRAARHRAEELAARHRIAIILPMDWDDPSGILNAAFVISETGEVLGCQTKNQLDPAEDEIFVPGTRRQIFTTSGVTFGIAICHEGFRYPETVRWATTLGAKLVFHPHCTGSDADGSPQITEWCGQVNRYFEHAMACRALENDVFFASINYGFKYPESATCVVDPLGKLLAKQPYGQPGVLVVDLDLELATLRYAKRLRPDTYSK